MLYVNCMLIDTTFIRRTFSEHGSSNDESAVLITCSRYFFLMRMIHKNANVYVRVRVYSKSKSETSNRPRYITGGTIQ